MNPSMANSNRLPSHQRILYDEAASCCTAREDFQVETTRSSCVAQHRAEGRRRAKGLCIIGFPVSNVRSLLTLRLHTPFFLLAACFQQVPQEELLVTPQHPFWGDVSSFIRCAAPRPYRREMRRRSQTLLRRLYNGATQVDGKGFLRRACRRVYGPATCSEAAPKGQGDLQQQMICEDVGFDTHTLST